MTTQNHARAWTLGLASAASLVLGIALMVHGDAIDQTGAQGSGWMTLGVLFFLVPILTGISAGALWLIGEISKNIRKERAWKQTLSPGERTAVEVAETAALFAAWAVVNHAVKESQARSAAKFQERSAHTQDVIAQHRQAVHARNESFR